MRRLSRSLLPELPPSVRQPQYDRENLKIGMAHIGVGAFHRCHQAEFIDDMLEVRFGPWGVMGINLAAPSLADLLAPQDCLYSRTLRQDARAETRIIGALRNVIDVTDKASAEAAVAALGGSGDFRRDDHRDRKRLLPDAVDRGARSRQSGAARGS